MPITFNRLNFWKGMALLFLGSIALIIAMLTGCSRAHPQGPMAMPVTMMPVSEHTYPDGTEFMAEVDSKHATDIHPQVSSRIVAVLVTDGAQVGRGQPLFQLDKSQVAPNVAAAKSDLAFSRKQLGRYRELVHDHTVSQKDTEEYETTLLSQEQKVKSLQADLNYYTVRAPFSGVVGTLIAKVGDIVDPNTVLTTLTDNRNLEIDVALSADYRSRVHLGTPMMLFSTDDAPLGESTISYIAPKVDPMTQTILVKARVINGRSTLAVDQHIKARLIWGERQAVLIPIPAVFRLDGQPFIYRADSTTDGKGLVAHMEAVTLGPIVGQKIVIESGLKSGQTLITGGIQKLQDGVPVMAMPTEKKVSQTN